jgi:hypothetical protein
MKFYTGKKYIHETFKDVFVETVIVNETPSGVALGVRWWNKSQTGSPYMIDTAIQFFNIKTEDMKKWREFL